MARPSVKAAVALVAAVTAAAGLAGCVADLPRSSPMPAGAPVLGPAGWYGLCEREPAECPSP